MSKMSKAIAVLGVVAGLGVAALPLSSYAASSQSAAAQVQVEVGGSISIAIVESKVTNDADVKFTAASGSNMAKLDLGRVIAGGSIKEGSLGVQVTTNDPIGYALTIAPVSAGATAMTGTTGGSIPAGDPSTVSDTSTDSAWGFKVASETAYQYFTENDATPIPLTGAKSGTAASDEVTAEGEYKGKFQNQTDVTFGVNAIATQLEGIYTGTAVFTATVQ